MKKDIIMTLKNLEIGQSATVVSVGGEGALRQHFLDMGLIPDADVTLVKYAPMGDPMELRIHGYELTLRVEDAEKIKIRDIRSGDDEEQSEEDVDVCNEPKEIPHPHWVKEERGITSRQTRILCLKENFLLSLLPAIKTAAKPRFLIS